MVYKIECERCNNVYIGETSRNAYKRGAEHQQSLDENEKELVLHRHALEKHRRRPTAFKMSVMSSHKTTLDRQTREFVRIANNPSDKLLNSKQEFGHNKNW